MAKLDQYNIDDFITSKIKNWNPETQTVYELVDSISKLRGYCVENDFSKMDEIDFANLPSKAMPADVNTDYPIWVMDFKNDLLVGERADTVMSLDYYYRQKFWNDWG